VRGRADVLLPDQTRGSRARLASRFALYHRRPLPASPETTAGFIRRLNSVGARIFAAACALGIAGCIGFCALGTALNHAPHDQSIPQANELRRQGEQFINHLAGAEAALHGFILTHQSDQARSFEIHRQEAIGHLRMLQMLTTEDVMNSTRIARLDRLTATKFSHMQQAADAVAAGSARNISAIIDSEQDPRLTQAIRETVSEIDTDTDRLSAGQWASAAQPHATPMAWLSAATVVAVALYLVTIVLAVANARFRRQVMQANIARGQRDHEIAALRSLLAIGASGDHTTSHELIRGVFESSADCIKVLDLDGRILSINGTACHRLSFDCPEQAIGHAWHGFWPAEQGADVVAAMEAAIGGDVGRFFAPTTSEDGTMHWWDVAVTSIRGTDGVPHRLLAVSRDITAMLAAETAVRDHDARLRSVFETAADGIVVAASDGRVVSANPAAIAIFGHRTEADLIGRYLSMLLPLDPARRQGTMRAASHPDSVSRTASGITSAMIAGTTMQRLAHRADGATVPVELSIASFAADDGTYLTGIVRDVSERNRAEAALRDSETRLRLAVRSADLGVCEYDYERGTIRFDERAAELSGGVMPANRPIHPDSPEFLHYATCVHPDDQARHRHYSESVRQGLISGYDITYRRITEDGRCIWLKATGTVMETCPRTGRARRMVGILMDVTPQAESEARLERLVDERTQALQATADELRTQLQRREDIQDALVQAQKMEALGQLTGGIVHDCNNILGAIGNVFELIRSRTKEDATRRLAGIGDSAVTRGCGIVQHLLAFSRRETVAPVRIDTSDLLREAEQMLQHSVGGRVQLAVGQTAGLWPVVADRHRLEVALINLAVNARDAMPNGGTLGVAARNLPAGAPRPWAAPDDDCVVISVTDTGHGMQPEVLARALEPFFTTKGAGKGTGLGLAMVHQFVMQSDGHLDIRSVPGEGTAIDIYLPSNDFAGIAEPSDMPFASAPGGDATILLVDGDDLARTLAAAVLEDAGYVVLEAADTDRACALARKTENLDLVIADLEMPGGSGPVLTTAIQAIRPDLPVVFIGSPDYGHASATARILARPFKAPGLLRFVAESLAAAPTVPFSRIDTGPFGLREVC
jgi:PAS domain S-box-containing protein